MVELNNIPCQYTSLIHYLPVCELTLSLWISVMALLSTVASGGCVMPGKSMLSEVLGSPSDDSVGVVDRLSSSLTNDSVFAACASKMTVSSFMASVCCCVCICACVHAYTGI